MIRFPNIFFSPEGAGAGGTADGGTADADAGSGSGGSGEHWTGQHEFFKSNPDAVKSFKDFKTPDDAFKAHIELRKQLSQPYRLPKDGAKLTAEQQAEIDGYYRKSKGVPDAPEGYEFETPEDVPIHEPTMEKFRALLHGRGVDPQTAKDLLGLQVGMVRELNAHRDKVFEGMGNNAYKVFKDTDCGGDADAAGVHMENIKKYLQTFAKDKDGNPSPAEWEGFCKRHFIKLKDGSERPTELILLRALAGPAMQTVGPGGAMPGGYNSMARPGQQLYAEMRK